MHPLQKAGALPGSGAPPGPDAIQSFGPSVRSPRTIAIESARKLITENRLDEADRALQSILQRSKKDAEAIFMRGMVAERRRQIPLAEQFARASLEIIEHPGTLLLLARCRRIKGETDETVKLCDRALAKAPGLEAARMIKGGALEEAGRYDEAIAEIDSLTAVTPNDELKRLALYLKAKACDRKKDYKGAYDAASAANEIGRLEFSPELYAEQVSVLIDNWSREKMKKFPVSTCTSDLPVFVAGMPRSGTSLIDQIIDAHPKAAGVGELATIEQFAHQLSAAWNPDKEPPACFGKFDAYRWTRTAEAYVKEIKGLAPPGVQRIVNKSLGNNKLVGLIARLFPKTRIIHAIRDPRDVAVSCFQGGFNNNLHPWTTRYEWIARAWEQSMRMMEHWKKSLDVPILDVHYEKLVKHPETEFPRIIEFLGLEWDAACTKFHESKRTVRTLSYDQVNRPLYTSSAGRNANYAPFMEGIVFPPYDPGV